MYLEVKNLHKSYTNGGKEVRVLKGLNLGIDKGKLVAVVGPSGAGKSTLLHILGGLDIPTQGKIIFAGEDVYSLSDTALSMLRNKKIGFVFQFYHLLPEFTVLENVLMPAMLRPEMRAQKRTTKETAVKFLSQAGLSERTSYFPNQLSGGEKQRVAIVRALINRPEMLLCDEPTGNLDSRTGSDIISWIKRINTENQMTVILVTHNLELAKETDTIYHLRDGVLVN